MDEACPKVSIMIPTYNQEKFIDRAIRSAINQSYENIEIIVSDDCSPDDTNEVVAKFFHISYLHYYKNEKNIGRVSNYRKTLYERASGDYVVNLDGDDEFTDSNFIRDVINEFQKYNYKPLMYVACKQVNLVEKGIKLELHKIKEDHVVVSGSNYVKDILYKYKFSHLTTVYNRSKAIEIDFYRSDIISSDLESLLRLAMYGTVLLSNKIVGQWYLTGENESRETDENKLLGNLSWIDSVGNDFRQYNSVFGFWFWKLRMQYRYTYPFFRSVLIKKRGVRYILSSSVKEGILLVIIWHFVVLLKKNIFRHLKK